MPLAKFLFFLRFLVRREGPLRSAERCRTAVRDKREGHPVERDAETHAEDSGPHVGIVRQLDSQGLVGDPQAVKAVVKRRSAAADHAARAAGVSSAAGGFHRATNANAVAGPATAIQGRRRPQRVWVRSLPYPARGSVMASQIRPPARMAPTVAGAKSRTSVAKLRK